MARKIRLSDIAAQAGVSTATVSRVLNGKDSVAPETRQAVIAALDLLGYERPEKLRERNGGQIGIIVPELTNPIFPLFTQYIASSMTLQGFTPLLGTQMAGGATEDSYVEAMIEQQVSGFVFISGLHADSTASIGRYERIAERNIPYVTINGAHPSLPNPDFSTDDVSAVRQAIRHLIALGHRKIGLASGPLRFIPSREKTETYLDVMRHMLPQEKPRLVHTLYTVAGGQSAAAQLIAAGCTAIICGSDLMALGAVRHCRAVGLSVPHDVSIVGFDDSPISGYADPPLTTLRQPVKTMAESAVSTLLAMIGGTSSDVGKMKFEPELIVRESTAIRR
ncbi:LacI family DNA-binding transcriptional regulator [Trueperella pecoris]|uniref:LacI family DNA-binding transcriptional regulator n=1 Tax=Trueperella pecoris TaxID=2733571 RepID=A0A7M1QVV0_9ACTO|nr:LacI family DNA-binding transcriptional regulator [Trueperella pecoris]QOQ39228.1 LacI family DNA-binding transcriptional regulator [Trueperella pecoris]QOR46139.1 LacI family DNA-binding transcriptional regulator [Trueperella pecoris]